MSFLNPPFLVKYTRHLQPFLMWCNLHIPHCGSSFFLAIPTVISNTVFFLSASTVETRISKCPFFHSFLQRKVNILGLTEQWYISKVYEEVLGNIFFLKTGSMVISPSFLRSWIWIRYYIWRSYVTNLEVFTEGQSIHTLSMAYWKNRKVLGSWNYPGVDKPM